MRLELIFISIFNDKAYYMGLYRIFVIHPLQTTKKLSTLFKFIIL